MIMKKLLIAVFIVTLSAAGAYAQTQRLNRTNSRTHDRSDASAPGRNTGQQTTNRQRQANHENDIDRNNTGNTTNTNGTGTRPGATNTGTGNNGVNTNGGTGTSGANIHSNNPR
jgi:hypothetical protein